MTDKSDKDVKMAEALAPRIARRSRKASPEDVRKAQALAPQLDPDMARAITEGNGPVIQAIANGATTNAEITQRLISLGLTTGLPPGVQQMVDEQMRQAADKREAENRNSEKLAAGMAGLALPGDTGEVRAETGGSGRGGMQDIFGMSFGQKMSYLSDIEDMSFEKFAAKSDAERRKDLENIKKDAEERLSTEQGELARYNEKVKSDPRLGATPEERRQAAAQIDAATNIKLSGEESEAEISKLPPELQALAREKRRIERAIYYNQNAITQADRAKEALDRGDLHGAYKLTTDAAAEKTADMRKNLGQNVKEEQAIAKELGRGGLTEERRAELVAREEQIHDENQLLRAELAAAAKLRYNNAPVQTGADLVRNNTAISQSEKALVETEASKRAVEERLKVKAGSTVAQLEGDNDFEAPTDAATEKTADARKSIASNIKINPDYAGTPERKSIDYNPVVRSGQLAPPLPEATQLAANDSPAADPNELQQQKVALASPRNDSAVG